MGASAFDRGSIEYFAIPIEGQYILYRPLLQLAVVGNQAMAKLADRILRGDVSSSADNVQEARAFLDTIGFLQPDPTPPAPMDRSYHPTMAVLLLTNRCNLRCTYCYANGGEGEVEDLAMAPARAIIDYVYRNAVELGRQYFELTFHGGGEPIQAWDTLQAAVAYARGRALPCRVSLVSNGVWTPNQLAWVLKHIDSLSISFDGAEETQDQQRPFASGRGSFKAVMRTIKALDAAGLPYGIRMTATAPWRHKLAKDVAFICAETGCRGMQVEPAYNDERGAHLGPTDSEGRLFVEGFMEAFELASRAGRQLVYSGARPWLLTRTFCSAPYQALIVDTSGRLVTCYEIASSDHALAQISTFGTATGASVSVDDRIRQNLLTHLDEMRADCHDCFCLWHCAGDCYTRAHAAAANGPPGANPRCCVNREITARMLLWYILAGDGVWRGQGLPPQIASLMASF